MHGPSTYVAAREAKLAFEHQKMEAEKVERWNAECAPDRPARLKELGHFCDRLEANNRRLTEALNRFHGNDGTEEGCNGIAVNSPAMNLDRMSHLVAVQADLLLRLEEIL